jgi:hypothetical protein
MQQTVDWHDAPNGATHRHKRTHMFYKKERDNLFYWATDAKFWCRSSYHMSHLEATNFISKEEDLKMKITSKTNIKDLPSGIFLKDRKGDVSVWNGRTLCVISPKHSQVDYWSEEHILEFTGLKYTRNSDNDLVAYSYEYGGAYSDIKHPSKKEIKIEELEKTIAQAQEQIKQLKQLA